MATSSFASDTRYKLVLTHSILDTDKALNRHQIRRIGTVTASNTTGYSGYSNLNYWSRSGPTSGSGNFTWDFSGSNKSKTLFDVTEWVTAAADGTLSYTTALSCTMDLPNGSGSASVSIPISFTKITNPPDAPSDQSVTRNSDTQATVYWTRNSSGNKQWTGVYIQRWAKSTGTWMLVATLTGTETSWVDTGITANNQYKYRVASYNSAGTSAYQETNTFATTPSAPNNLVASKTGSDITLTWNNTAVHQNGTIIYDNETEIGTVGSGVATFTHASPNPSITHTYTTRATTTTPSLQSALSAASNTVQLQAPPNAPTNLAITPTGVLSIESTNTSVLSWNHNPVDASTQTARQVQYRVPGSGSWITYIDDSSVDSNIDIVWANLTNGGTDPGDYKFQVRTKGADPSYSVYSATLTVTRENNPVITLLQPEPNDTLTTSDLELSWNYSQAQGKSQVSVTIVLIVDGTTVFTQTRSGTSTTWIPPYTLKDDKTYQLLVYVTAANGLKSTTQVINFTVDYLEPTEPDVVGYFNESTGTHQLIITNSDTPITTQLNRVYRSLDGDSWELLGEYPPNESILDNQGKTRGTTYYRVEAISIIPSSSETIIQVESNSSYVWLSGGNQFENRLAIPYNFELDEATNLVDSEVFYPDGGEQPVLITGEAYSYVLSVSGSLDPKEELGGTWKEFQALLRLPGIKLYQDRDGRRVYSNITSGTNTRRVKNLYNVSFTVQEVSND